MGETLPRTMACFCLLWTGGWLSGLAGDHVAFQAPGGRFLRAAADGTIRADRLLPGEEETFDLTRCEDGRVALRTRDGRLLVAAKRDPSQGSGGLELRSLPPRSFDPKTPKSASERAEPDDRATFVLVPAGGNRVTIRAGQAGDFIVWRGSVGQASAGSGDPRRAPAGAGSGDAHTAPSGDARTAPIQLDATHIQLDATGEAADAHVVRMYRVAEVPSVIRSALTVALRTLVIKELADKEYDKVRIRKRQTHVDLPAPTLDDPGRKKKLRLLSTQEEYHLQARLDGRPDIQIVRMPCLRGYHEKGTGLVMLALRASLPVAGRVGYKIPKLVSASTGFRGVVELAMVGQMRLGKSETSGSLCPPEVLELDVQIRRLDISNDVLQLSRGRIEDLVNRELHEKRDRIARKANDAIRKSVEQGKVRGLPLIGSLLRLQ
jgi:hypothetical protein